MAQFYLLSEKNVNNFIPLLPPDMSRELQTNKATFAIGAVSFGVTSGILVAEMVSDIINIRYISVNKFTRHSGIAKGMVHFLQEYAMEEGMCIVCDFKAQDQNTPIYSFFIDMGGYSIEKQVGTVFTANYKQMMDTLQQLPEPKKHMPELSFYDTKKEVRSQFYNRLIKSNLLYIDISSDEYDRELSCCCLDKREQKKIGTAIFVKKDVQESGHIDLDLSYVWCAKGEEASMVYLFKSILGKIQKWKTQDITLHIAAVNASSEGLVKRLLLEKDIESSFYRAIWDMEA